MARSKSRGAMTAFGVEDFSRTPLPRLLRMLQAAVDAGADLLTLPDTLGVLTPASTRRIVRLLRALLGSGRWCSTSTTTWASRLANTLAGLEAGAEMVHVTVNGVGERAGNTCLEELAVVLAVKYGRDLGFELTGLARLCRLVHRLSGTEPPAHKAVTGRWAFTHEAGIHVAGVLANPECYQPYPAGRWSAATTRSSSASTPAPRASSSSPRPRPGPAGGRPSGAAGADQARRRDRV